jgi:exopolyphosphatase / guanosine-5'-triphosphate,3'-diphosphate pyrophosphatase
VNEGRPGGQPVHAALDIGSNTVRLLVARVSEGVVHALRDEVAYSRLGRGVEATGSMQADRMDDALQAITRFVELARDLQATSIRAVGTSALRDAANSADFVARVHAKTGIEVEIVSGKREAALTFRGATAGHATTEDELVVDLGGGSMEIVRGRAGVPDETRSMQVGAGRLTERFVHHDPPDAEEISAIERAASASVPIDFLAQSNAQAFITGGTAAHAARTAKLEPLPATVTTQDLDRALAELMSTSAEGIAERFDFHIERARVLPAGVAILRGVLSAIAPRDAWIVLSGLREGLLLEDA